VKPTRHAKTVALLAAALLSTGAVYSRSIRGEFQFDDGQQIMRSPIVKQPERLFAPEAWSFANRPLTMLTVALNYQADRLDPFGYHVVNVVIHLAVAILLFFLSRKALRGAGVDAPLSCAAAVAGLFALHPLQTESVSYVIQRAESLAALLYVATLLLLLETETATARWHAALSYAAALLLAAAALFAKQTAATLPAAYLLYSHVFPPPGPTRPLFGRRLALALPLFAFSAFAAQQGIRATRGTNNGCDMPVLGIHDYLLTQLRVAFRYLGLLLWPSGQNVDPDVWVSRSLVEPETCLAAIALAAVTFGAIALVWQRVRSPPGRWTSAARVAAFGLLWFVLQLLPSSLVPLSDVMAEHRVYLASWGVFLALIAIAQAAANVLRLASTARVAVLLGVWGAFAAVTWVRNGVWETQVALWSDATQKSSSKSRAYANLGWAHELRGDHAGAIEEYRKALERNSDSYDRAAILTSMGSSLVQLGRYAEGSAALMEAATEPCLEADARNLLALSLFHQGLADAAREQVIRALHVDPDHGAARNTLGQILLDGREVDAALTQFRIAVRLNPDVPARRFNVAVALERLGRIDESCAAWREYLDVERGQAGMAAALPHLGILGCRVPRQRRPRKLVTSRRDRPRGPR